MSAPPRKAAVAASLASAVLVLVLLPGGAQARVVTKPVMDVPAFVKPRAETFGGVTSLFADLRWRPPVFDPVAASNHVDIAALDQTAAGGVQARADAGPAASTISEAGVGVQNGHTYVFLVVACESGNQLCGSLLGAVGGEGRVDGMPPAGTVRIEEGRAFTNRTDVTLDLAAEDPLIDGRPGTSSGVTQVAVDRDGDGTYPCASVFNGGETSGCAVRFAPRITATLPPGDGLKTVGVTFGDGAREFVVPCTGRLCISTVGGTPLLGNASAPATDTIILDTVAPTATARASTATATTGQLVTFDLAAATDGGDPAVASGVDPASASWDFGDGVTGTGTSATHSYATPGTFTATVTVADRAGNRSAPSTVGVTVVAAVAPGTPAAGATAAPAATTATTNQARITRLRPACAPRPKRAAARRAAPCRPALAISLTRRSRVALVVRKAGMTQALARLNRTAPTGSSVIVLPARLVARLGAGRFRVTATPAGGTAVTATVRLRAG